VLYDQYFTDVLKDRADLVRAFRCCLLFVVGSIAIVSLSAGSVIAQPSEAKLFLEFETFACSEFRSLTDMFMAELAKDPKAIGYVVNTSPNDRLEVRVFREELIRSQIELRNFDRSRIVFERGDSDKSFLTQFWKAPDRENAPAIEHPNNSLTLSLVSKPRLLISHTFYNDSECPDLNYPRVFARFLEANPGSRGNLVVYGRSAREARGRERKTIQILTSQYGIAQKRIRVFTKIEPYDPIQPKGIEYWYLP
jgi:hypothetical protein